MRQMSKTEFDVLVVEHKCTVFRVSAENAATARETVEYAAHAEQLFPHASLQASWCVEDVTHSDPRLQMQEPKRKPIRCRTPLTQSI